MLKRLVNRQTPLIGALLTRAFGPRTLGLRYLELLSPYAAVGMSKLRVGNPTGDGGYVMVDSFHGVSAALSIGIGNDVSWDFDVASRGIEIFQYDHTLSSPPSSHPKFHFQAIGVARNTSEDGRFRSLTTMVSEIPEAGDLILKMDVEGAEWSALSSNLKNILERFSQMVIEVHWPFSGTSRAKLRRLRTLRKLNKTHRVVHLHANNYGDVASLEGVNIPNVIEITYLRKRGHHFVPAKEHFPTILDIANEPSKSEISMTEILRQAS